MAQLGNLTVTGSSRFLNKINGACTDGTSGTTKYMRQDGTWQVPPNDNTDTKVSQTASSTNANYEVLLSGTADNTTRTEGANKSSGFVYNPNKYGCVIGLLKSNTTIGSYATAFGYGVEASGTYSCAHGAGSTASGESSHAEGGSTTASGSYAHTEGYQTTANSSGGHAEGLSSSVSGPGAHAEGEHTTSSSQASHAEGGYTTASSYASHSEGNYTTASGYASHAEGDHTTANHKSQHVFGEYNIADTSTEAVTARGNYVEIVGNGTSSTRANARTLDWSGNEWLQRSLTVGTRAANSTYGVRSLSVGDGHVCSGTNSVAEGDHNTVTGKHSHVEGTHNTVDSDYAHGEGQYTTASGYYCHVEGDHTIANHKSQHVFGEYNIADPSTASSGGKGTYIEIVGNGKSSERANARTLNWSGNEWIAGTLTQGSSIEIKKNVADMTQEDGDKILNLRPVVFDYKSSEKDVQAERGFIAEEVKEIIPNLVTDKIVNDNGDTVAPASLNYIAMIPYLVKVCQRQQEEIDRLKSLIAEK